jgi:hypothetical protein
LEGPSLKFATRLGLNNDRASQRVARFLERRGILERNEDNNYLTPDGVEVDPLQDIYSHSVAYRIAVGPQMGRKVFCLDHSTATGRIPG